MRKFFFRFSAFFIALFIAFFSIPFQDVKAVPSWDNLIYALKTNFGIVSADNGTLSGIDNNTFYGSLYETTLYWDNSAFVPAETFSSKAEWIKTCSDRGNPDVIGFHDFDIVQSLQQAGYITLSDGNYDFSNFPKLDNSTNVSSPLDGIEVKTNFSDFNPQFSILKRPSSVEQTFNNFKNSFLAFDNRLTIIACGSGSNYMSMYYSFFSPNNNVDFYGFYYNTAYQRLEAYCHDTSSWVVIPYVPQIYAYTINSSGSYLDGANLLSGNNSYFYSNRDFSDYDSSVFSVYNRVGNYTTNFGTSYWSNIPVVIGSNTQVIQNYYYWLNGSPSGQIYTTTNTTNNVYTQDFIENNDWQEIYNNYVTDVSNYYSTTENITNEQLTQYIDNSTTITNITNNYITNNNVGGSGEDDIITNSWLERIYQKLLVIIDILRGSSDPDSDDIYYTDNSIKNDIVEYPLSDLFPTVPDENFLPANIDFSFPVASEKVSDVMFNTIPFCYIEQLKIIAGSLSLPPIAPHYEIPFVIDSANIDENVVIDLSGESWSTIHSVWIVLFMIVFIVALLYMTYRFIIFVSSIIG